MPNLELRIHKSKKSILEKDATISYIYIMNVHKTKPLAFVGGALSVSGFLAAICGFLGTVFYFFNNDKVLLAMIALFVPPADVVLGFVAHPVLGALATGGTFVAYVGLAIASE